MITDLRSGIIGGLIGAVVAVTATFGAARLGYFPPPSDTQFHDYLMSHSSIVFAMSEKAQVEQADSEERQLQAAVDRTGLKAYFDPRVAFVTGPRNAKKSFVEFFDYNCGHCRNSFPLVQKFFNTHKGDTRFAFIEFPIFGEASNNAARAAIAARLQGDKYVAFHFALMAEDGAIGTDQMVDAARKAGLDLNKLTADLKEKSIDKQMAAAHALASRTGITGTPFFIINGRVHSGEVDQASLKQMSKS
jgi:protein-disulfide isomerase